jgi:hypothetical protein
VTDQRAFAWKWPAAAALIDGDENERLVLPACLAGP